MQEGRRVDLFCVVFPGSHWAAEVSSSEAAGVSILRITHMYLVHVSVHKKETKAQATQHRKGKDTHRCHDCFGGMYGILFSVLSLTLGGPVVVNRIPIVCGHTTIPTTTTTTKCHLGRNCCVMLLLLLMKSFVGDVTIDGYWILIGYMSNRYCCVGYEILL